MDCISERLYQRAIHFILLFLLGVVPGFAATYYVSNTGNDSNTGLSTSQPWATLARVNAAAFVPGDQILFQRGSTFYGSVTVKNSGAEGKPITFSAYGTGANPVITGFTTVTAWKSLGNNIWESTNPVSTLETCNMVVMNGVNTAMGRYPNADAPNGGYLTFQSHSGKVSITSSSLTGTSNWTGAEVVIRTSNWTIDKTIIASQSGGTLNFTALSGYTPSDGYGFFIQNDARTLDQSGEWYYNPSTKKIQIYSISHPTSVKVASIDSVVIITGNYITIDGIDITGANSYLVYANSYPTYNTVVKNCVISGAGISAIMSRSIYLGITNNVISDANGSGLQLDYSRYTIVSGNKINNINVFQGMGQNGTNSHFAYGGYNIIDATVENNTISNIGGSVISCYGNALIKNNLIDTFGFVIQDVAGIYTFVGAGTPFSQVKIEGNIVLNGVGAYQGTIFTSSQGFSNGIYLDDNSNNVEVFNNTVANNGGYGIFCHNNQNVNIYNNLLYNNSLYQIIVSHNSTGNMVSGIALKNNKFISKLSSQSCILLSTTEDYLSSFGVIDSNYFARPIDDNITINTNQSQYEGYVSRTLSQWQSFSGQDANSHKSPIAIQNEDDLKFEYNATKEPKILTIDVPMMDVTGAKYFGKLTLLPFTSVVLIKDPKTPIATTEYRTICEGTNYNGYTNSGKYERKEISASGDYSLVTILLTVTPVQKVTENVTVNEGEEYQGWKQAGTYTRKLLSVGGCDSLVTTHLQVVVTPTKEADLETTQILELNKGYNLISTYVTATNADAGAITQALREQNLLVKMQDEAGHSFENWGSYGGWVNKIGVLENTEGYQIQVANDCTLQVKGLSVNLPLDIALKTGWNIISFPRIDGVNAMDIIQPLIDQKVLVKVQDEAGNSIEDWGMFGGWKNDIGNFSAGKAYKVQLKADAMLTIQENYPKSALVLAQPEKTEYFIPRLEGNGTDHMNINIVGLGNAGIAIGDELAAFDGVRCVGSAKITETNLSNLLVGLVASFSTDDLNPDGFKAGNPIHIYVWNKQTGEKSKVNAEIIRGQMVYEKNASVLISLKSLSTGVAPIDDVVTVVFPNPSNGRFTVRFSKLPDAGCRIELVDVSGRQVVSRLVTQTSEEFNLENQAPGLYLVKTITGSKEKVHKIIIN